MKCVNFRPKLLCRNRIYKMLDEVFNVSLLFVSAPMGYGKTTVVKEYLDNIKATENIIWFSILDEENDENWVWNEFMDTLKCVDNNVMEALKNIGFPDNGNIRRKIISIIKENIKNNTIIVIDDWHNIMNPKSKIDILLQDICTEQIEKLHIIIISRKYPEDKYIELETKSKCVILTEKDIKFTLEETKEFFLFNGVKLTENQINKVYTYTDGWTAAVYLSLLEYNSTSLLGDIPKAEELIKIAVYNRYNRHMQKALLKLSLLKNFSIEQACYITKNRDTAIIIKELQNENCFIRYDRKTKLYTMHAILRNALMDELYTSDINSEEIYNLSGEWYYKNNDSVGAIQYYYKSKNYNKILEVMNNGALYDYLDKIPMLIISIFDNLTMEQKYNNPKLYLTYTICYLFGVSMKKGKELIQDAEDYFSKKNDLEEKQEIMAEIDFFKGVASFNDIYKMTEYYEKADKLFDGKGSKILGNKFCFTMGAPVFIEAYHIKEGNLKSMTDYFQHAFHVYNKVTNNAGVGGGYMAYAEYYFHTGNLDKAKIYAEKALYKSHNCNALSVYICSLFILARISLQYNQEEDFFAYIDKLKEVYKDLSIKLYLDASDTGFGYIFSIINKFDKVPYWIMSKEQKSEYNYFSRGKNYMTYIIQSLHFISKKKYIELAIHAENMLSLWEKTNNIFVYIYANILYSISQYYIYGIKEAEKPMTEALKMAKSDGIIMPFVELSLHTSNIIKKLKYKDDFIKKIISFSERFLAGNASFYSQAAHNILTKREKQIMEYLSNGYTQSQIADALTISISTVKKHSSSVYLKLGVKNKTMALKILKEKKIIK